MSSMVPKPIRWKPTPVSTTPFRNLNCDRCGASINDDWKSGFRYEDTDMGDYIERREVEKLCGNCMSPAALEDK